MKLLSFDHRGRIGYGLVRGDGVVDLSKRVGSKYPTLQALLAQGALAQVTGEAASAPVDFPLSEITYLPPIPAPEKMLCIGINYVEHAAEGKSKVPEKPLVFTRFNDTVVGHEQALVRPFESDKFDYEVELCVIIGKEARRVSKENALDYVAGYTIFNDGSIRDWQRHTTHFTAGKNFFKSGSVGPWMVTADEVPDPQALRVTTKINGAILQDGTTKDMVFGVRELIAYISTFTPLYPGDLIATGTPSGVGYARTPPIFMKPGDALEMEVEKVGILRNSIIDG